MRSKKLASTDREGSVRLYKFMTRHWANEMVRNGSIRIGTLFDYGDTEKYGSAIGDELEGHREYFSVIAGTKTLGELNSLEAMPFRFEGVDPSRIKFTNLTVSVNAPRPNLYLFSASSNDSLEAQERINADNAAAGRDPYDSCVEITSALRFFSELTRFMTTQARAIPQAKGMCTYADHRIDFNAPAAHWRVMPAMVKRVEHSYQSEYRALWRDLQGSNDIQPVMTQIPAITPYVRLLR